MSLEPQHYITLALAGVAAVTWLVRLEGRVNALKAKEAGHDATRDEVIRLQEQIKFLIQAVQEMAQGRPRTRRTPE